MEVAISKRTRGKTQPNASSKCNGSSEKVGLMKGKVDNRRRRKTDNCDQSDNKRKSLKKNDESVSLPKKLKPVTTKVKDEENTEKQKKRCVSVDAKIERMPAVKGKGKDVKSVQRHDGNKTIKTKLLKSKANKDEGNEFLGKKDKLQLMTDMKTDNRKRKVGVGRKGGESRERSSCHLADSVGKYEGNDANKNDDGPSPAKMKKVEKEVKNSQIKILSKTGKKGKSASSSRKPVTKSKNVKKSKEKVGKQQTSIPPMPAMNTDDPMAMLMMMEGVGQTANLANPTLASLNLHGANVNSNSLRQEVDSDEEMDDSDDTDLSDMEDVKDFSLPVEEEEEAHHMPTESVQITLDMPDILNRKRKKKEFDWKKYLEKRVRKFKKDVAIYIHKSHILCLIALGLRQNSVLNDEMLRAQCLSLLPSHLIKSATTCLSTERVVDSAMAWYRNTFPLNQVTHTSGLKLISVKTIVGVISKNVILDARMWVYAFIVVLRVLGLSVRLVLSLQPIPFKVFESSNGNSTSTSSKPPASSKPDATTGKKTATATCSSSHSKTNNAKRTAALPQSPSQKLSSSLSCASSSSKCGGKTSASTSSSKSSSSSSSAAKKMKTKTKSSPTPHRSLSERMSSREARIKSKKNLKEESDDEDDFEEESDNYLDKKATKKKGKDVVKKTIVCKDLEENSDSDFEVSSPYFGRNHQELKVKSNRKMLSEDEDSSHERAQDFWLEIFMADKKKWICLDCFKNVFDKPYSLENRATQPVTYVVAFKNDNGVRDVTARYTRQWFSLTRKQRVDAEWLEQTFSLFGKTSYQETLLEEDQIKGQLMVRPMPSTIGDFKNHPLYALQRHLLKFEAIYPDTAIPLGYIRKEPVYARECVRTLHSRHNWVKEGRLVRLNEQPYKNVKSRPKWNKPKENPEELDLELFGEWQTEKYIPPPAVNGKVPRNEYGNVELFKPWMLPAGTVQLRLQGLQRVAKKLNIDVAPAMVGWDHHSGHPHPVFDGFIVCQEFADTLLDAWDEDQEIQKQKEDEKREKRVYGNWKLLIRGLLIKERLKNKFLKDEPVLMDTKEPDPESKGPSTSAPSLMTTGRSGDSGDDDQGGGGPKKKTSTDSCGVKTTKEKKKKSSALH